MKNKILICIILMILLASAANAEQYFVLDVNHILDYITFNGISLREIDRTIKYNGKSGFLIKTVSFENSDIKTIYYNMSENRNYIIYIPYDENAAKVEIYNLKNSKIMDIDVSSFADTCGNNICEEYESYESCTKDCSSGSKDDFCDRVADDICDPDCSLKTDIDCTAEEINETDSAVDKKQQIKTKIIATPKQKTNYLIWILPTAMVIIFVLIFFVVKKTKESRVMSTLKQYISENIRKGYNLKQIKEVLFREGYTETEVDKAIKSL